MPKLLFVTDPEALTAAIGSPAAEIIAAIRNTEHELLIGPGPSLRSATCARLAAAQDLAGVVLLGGYSVVPSEALKSLPTELANARISELDDFTIWSDDGYGDRDGDITPELPVSRIPDAGSAAFLWSALTNTCAPTPASSSGIRNRERPFADSVYARLPNNAPLHCSAPHPNAIPPPFPLDGDLLYLMLHGDHADATTFNGEDANGIQVRALHIDEVPSPCPKVVFAGCCWGGLIVDELARLHPIATTPRNASNSIALRCLKNGANAFVGCTGAHYSPPVPGVNNYGGPMHHFFWSEILSGHAPAAALFRAKIQYAQTLPARVGASITAKALEHKILRQFTCLGLGW